MIVIKLCLITENTLQHSSCRKKVSRESLAVQVDASGKQPTRLTQVKVVLFIYAEKCKDLFLRI